MSTRSSRLSNRSLDVCPSIVFLDEAIAPLMPLPKAPTKPATVLTSIPPEPARETSNAERPHQTVVPLTPVARAPQAPHPSPGRPTPAARLAVVESKPQPAKGPAKKPRSAGPPRLFVLDTNVLLHDPTSLFRFEEHDVFLPMMTLEELDSHKKGMSEVARSARQVSRTLDSLVAATKTPIEEGIPLSALGNKDAAGRLIFQTQAVAATLPASLPAGNADNQILGVVHALKDLQTTPRDVVLVSKDINMRQGARARFAGRGLHQRQGARRHRSALHRCAAAARQFLGQERQGHGVLQHGGFTVLPNQWADRCRTAGQSVRVSRKRHDLLCAGARDSRQVCSVAGVARLHAREERGVGNHARNREQSFALNLLMDPECDFVTLIGQAGTGKTLLALAAGLSQTLETKRFSEIIVTRATVPVGDDIGFLPGTEEEKMAPWMGALEDNLEVLNKTDDNAGEWGRAATNDLIRTGSASSRSTSCVAGHSSTST